MTKKDRTLMANLINPEAKKMDTAIVLNSVQMAQIAKQIQAVQIAVEEVHMG